MSRVNRDERVRQLNVNHRLNALALECLVGVADADCGALGVVELLRHHWDNMERSKLFKQQGAPKAAEVLSLLEFLDRADPDKVMHFVTHIGQSPAVEVGKLEELDAVDIAHKLLGVLFYQLALGTALVSDEGDGRGIVH
jgi:hypothetical protein